MKSLIEVMKTTGTKTDRSYLFFDQCLYTDQTEFGQEQKKGVCTALVLRWIKSFHKHGFIKSSSYENTKLKKGQTLHKPRMMNEGGHASFLSVPKNRTAVNNLQADYEREVNQGDGVSRILERAEWDHGAQGAFGSLNARIVPVFSNSGVVHKISYADFVQSKMGQTRQEFMAGAAKLLTSIGPSDAMMVGLSFEGRALGHTVAVARADKEFMFFDPNAGILTFKGGGCKQDFEMWFREKAIEADADHYDIISKFELTRFQLSTGTLPKDPMVHWAHTSTVGYLGGSQYPTHSLGVYPASIGYKVTGQ